jgi:hypothetical protein
MVIRLVTEFRELLKLAWQGRKRGGLVWEEVWELLGFVTLVCVWVYFCSGGCLCQGLQEARECTVGTVG